MPYIYSRPYIFFLPNFPGPKFIPCPTSIPDSTVPKWAQNQLKSQILFHKSSPPQDFISRTLVANTGVTKISTIEEDLLPRTKEIEIIHRLFLVIAMYGQASSSQFSESLNLPHCQLAGKEGSLGTCIRQQFTRNNLYTI